jgi:hypothetical protein
MKFPITISVAPRFWYDHKDRGCSPTAEVIKYTEKNVTVLLDEQAWSDLYSDAEYYGGSDGNWFGGDYRGLVASARSTLRKMQSVQS